MKEGNALGVDIGGSSIKAALVDLRSGKLVSKRYKLPTPRGAEPDDVIRVVKELLNHESMQLPDVPLGIGFPSVIKHGTVMTATNISPAWQGQDLVATFSEALERAVAVLNDADAAGLAEIRYGAGAGVGGTIVAITLGTGLGTALFSDSELVAGSELANFYIRGKPAQALASRLAMSRQKLTWKQWAKNVSEFLQALDGLVWADLFIIAGGASEDAPNFIHLLKCRPPVVVAAAGKAAGIIGAARFAAERSGAAHSESGEAHHED